MILEIAVLDVKLGEEEAFEKAVVKAVPALAAAEGCHGVEIMRSVEKSSRYRLLVRWSSVEHHAKFRKTAAVLPLRAVLTRYAASGVTAEHMAAIKMRAAAFAAEHGDSSRR